MKERLWCLAVASTLFVACNDPVYLAEVRPLEVKADATGTIAADNALYVLPVKSPTAAQRAALIADQKKRGLVMVEPWAQKNDFDIEIDWSVTNLDTQAITAFFSMNGGTEFGDFVPALFIDPDVPPEDQIAPPNLAGGSPLALAAGATIEGTFREDQFDEMAIDMAAIIRYPIAADPRTTPFVVLARLSTEDPTGLEAVPKNDVTASMVRFAFMLTASGHARAQYEVRVRDHNGKLAHPSDANLYVSTAAQVLGPGSDPNMLAGKMQ